MSRIRIEQAVSAGGVVYRETETGVEIALCGRRRPRTWNLPKGTPDAGETLEQTALREVQEETGLQVEVRESLGDITYWFNWPQENVRYHKTVYFYLMEERGGSIELHDPEFDEVQWFQAQDALKALTYTNEINVVERALHALAQRGVHDRH